MKVGKPAHPTPAPVSNGTPAAPANGTTAAASASAIPAQADPSAKIELSNNASALMTGGSSPEFDSEKVARISKSIDDGTFKINPEAIADKLISNAQELLKKSTP